MFSKVHEKTEKEDLKEEFNRRIDFILNKPVVKEEDVYVVVKDFFKDYFGEKKEYTVGELEEKLYHTYVPQHLRQFFVDLLEKLELLEYTPKTFTQEELEEMLSEFKNKINELLKEFEEEKKSFIERVADFLVKREEHREKSGESKVEPAVSEMPAVEHISSEEVEFNKLLEKVYYYIDKEKLKKAEKRYKELLEKYELMNRDLRKKNFSKIDRAHSDLVTASS